MADSHDMRKQLALKTILLAALVYLAPAALTCAADAQPPTKPATRLRLLFLGDNGHHKPADRAAQIIPVMRQRGIDITYIDHVDHLNPAMLNQYDGLIIYANITRITPAQESALLEFVASGGGFVPLHCASYCFLNSPKYIALVGAQFKRHKAGVFRVKPVRPEHEVLKDYKGFESWDETYVHAKHNTEGRTVLETRREGDTDEPWTWVRTEGKGRVFYTAWGHDQRTWSNPGFHDLVERGVRWATRPRVEARLARVKPVNFVRSKDPIPNYTPGKRWGTQDKGHDFMQAPLPPEDSAKRIVTPPGLRAELFAAEPDIRPALAMAWDERGRLWLCESIDYPNELQPRGQGRDTIRICEDTDGDGRADKFTLFADKLSVPIAITQYRGGVIVQDGTQTVYLKDTDGDDKADLRKVLIDGWNQGDTHGGVSNFTWGLDNHVWAMQGYNNSAPRYGPDLKTQAQAFRMGFFRFRLDGADPPTVEHVEFIRSTNNNTWGFGFSEEGLVFGSTANRNPSDFMPIPNRYYERVRGWAPGRLNGIANHHRFYPVSGNVRQVDHHGGYTAAAGHRLYTARTYPREYWNRVAFVNGPTGKLTGAFTLRAVEAGGAPGSAFASSNDWNLAASDDEWFAPIDAQVGPDGCVWLLDWYNYIVQHNPTPVGFKSGKGNAYETKLRDKRHGRVFRIAPTGGVEPAIKSLQDATPNELVAALASDNLFWRRHAQRLLIERGRKDVAPALIALVRNRSTDAIGLNVGAIHALWTLHGLNALHGKGAADARAAAVEALRHPSAGVRRNAVLVLPRDMPFINAILDAGLLNDADAQVRLATLLALADQPGSGSQPPSDRVGAAVYAMLQQPRNVDDRWIPDAAVSAAVRHNAGFLAAALGGTRAQGKKTAPSDRPKPPAAPKPVNLIKNGSFEAVHQGKPQHWRTVTYSGAATHALALSEGRDGSHAVKITAEKGADASWTYDLPVKPNTRYRVTAWVKGKGFTRTSGLGALINLHQLQKSGKTNAISKDADWTRITSEFETAGHTALALNLLFGGWGHAKGTAWWDDVTVIELGPATGKPAPVQGVAGVSGKLGQVLGIVTRDYAQSGPVGSVLATLAALKGADERLSGFVLDGLVEGWPVDTPVALSPVDRAELAALSQSLPVELRDRLVVLARKWGATDAFAGSAASARAAIVAQLNGPSVTEAQRIDAAQRLIRLDDTPASINVILQPINPQASSTLSAGLVSAVGASRQVDAGRVILQHWRRFTPAARRPAVGVLLRREAWTASLLDAIDAQTLSQADLTAADWQLLKLHKNQSIADRAAKLDAQRGDSNRAKVLARMLPYLDAKADVGLGAAHFKKLCAQCHSFQGKGGRVGPDLTGIASRDPKDILAEIVDPNRSLESNFRLWVIQTADGDNLSGRLDTESRTSVELLDLQGKRHVIQRRDIVEMTAAPLSIMPVGLIDMLTPQDVASLIAYLRQSHAPAE